MKIEILAWEKFNPRKDVKSATWFRMDNNFCSHPRLYDLTNDQKMVWVYLMCEAGKKNGPLVTINLKQIADCLKIKMSLVDTTVQFLAKQPDDLDEKPFIKIFNKNHTIGSDRIGPSNILDPYATDGRTDERTDVTDERTHYLSSLAPEEPSDRLPVKALAQIWNTHKAKTQPAVDLKSFKPTTTRYRQTRARLIDHPDLGYWEDIVKRIAASSFCRGDVQVRTDRPPWIADFSFLIRPETHLKVLEGKYDDRKQRSAMDEFLELHGDAQ